MSFIGSDGKRRISRTRNRGRIDVCSLIKQDSTNINKASRGRLHQRRQPGLSPMFHIGLAIQQQRHDLMSALKTGQSQGRIPIGLNLGIDVRTHVQQQLDRGRVTIHSRQHQGRNAQLGPRPGVDLRPVGQQQFDDIDVA